MPIVWVNVYFISAGLVRHSSNAVSGFSGVSCWKLRSAKSWSCRVFPFQIWHFVGEASCRIAEREREIERQRERDRERDRERERQRERERDRERERNREREK